MKTTIDQLPQIAELVLKKLVGGSRPAIIALHGDLGSGKTTFTQVLARTLGCVETVVSPTFVILKKYTLSHPLYTTLVHIDAYRISSPNDIKNLKLDEEFKNTKSIIVIEWPEHVSAVIPSGATHLTLSYVNDTERDILGI